MNITQHRYARIVIAAIPAALLLFTPVCSGPQRQGAAVPQADTNTTDADGAEHVTRVVPLPETVSPEAQKWIASGTDSLSEPLTPVEPTPLERRATMEKYRAARAEEARKLYPVDVKEQTMGGVRCDVIKPLNVPAGKRDRVLINVHGGGFVADSGSIVEGAPIAYLTGTTVVSVYYRMPPEHPFPAAVDDTEAVYKELLKTYKPAKIGLFGTSAGAVLTAQVAARLRRDGLPLPGVLGVFSGSGDMARVGDTSALYTSRGFNGLKQPPSKTARSSEYVGSTDRKDPVLSPIYSDLKGFPPTLFITSTRDSGLSGTTILHRAFLSAGVDTELVVFEALPHAFWYRYEMPETKEALDIMAKFFNKKLGG